MGASREGIMSVRERINLVLQETPLSEDKDAVGVSKDAKSVPTTDTNTLESRAADQIVLLSRIPPGGSSSEGGEEVDVIEESLTTSSDPSHDVKAESVEKFSLIVLRQLLRQQLGVINTLGEKLKIHGNKFEAVNNEKNELHTKLEREREEQASLQRDNAKLLEEKMKADKLILEQIAKIQELEQQLAKVTAPKAVEERSTCMTPAPPPQQIPNQLRVDNEDRLFATPTPPASHRAITDLRSMYASQAQRSDSPPQLSPACTPRSLPQNVYTSRGSRGLGRFLRGDDDDSDDEFEDELQCLTNPMDQEANEPNYPLSFRPQKSSAFHVSHQPRRVHSTQFVSNNSETESRKRRMELSPYSDSAPPNKRECINNQRPSLFARPFPRPRNSRLMFADSRRRYFINNSLGRNRFVGSHFRQSMNSLGLPKNNLGDNGNSRSISSQSTSTRPPPQLIGIRNNNFLNVARPIPKKCTPSASKNSTATGPVNHSPQFVGSLEYDDTEVGRRRDETIPELDTVNHSVKRGIDTCLSKHKFRLPGQSSSSPSSSLKVSRGRSLQSSLPNGIGEQRFSQRGRLLKPNRARYSPDPDISVNPREKCMTTKKSYFVPEPSVQEAYRDEASGKMGAASTTGEPEEEENEPICTTGDSAVEVPKWRIISFGGFKDDAERIPPDDDMSEEAFHKRHQKLEAKEKQRKRWDSQRMREESYRERLKRKQEERERQKELRRQRKRKGRTGCTSDEEQESLLPRLEDIKAIYVNKKLPVGTYGFTLPLVEKVDFQLLWRPKPVSIRVDCESSRKDDDGNSNQQQLSSSSVSRNLQRSPSPPSTSDSRPLPSSTCLLPSPTSLEISNLSLSLENIPPENANNSDSSSSNPTSTMLSSGSTDPKVINVDLTFENESDNPRVTAAEAFDVTTPTITIAEEGEVDSTSSSPIFTINLTDFDPEDNECNVADSNSSAIDQVNCIRRSPSPVPEEESSYEPASSSSESVPCENAKSFTKLPLSSSSPKSSSIVTPVSTASITFLIPANPLAPRHSHPPINTITSPSNKGKKVCSSTRPNRTSSLSEDYRGKDGSFGS